LWQCYRLIAFGNTIVLMEKVSLCATLIEFHLFSPHNGIVCEDNANITQDARTCIYQVHVPDVPIKTLNTCADVVTDTT
jgi:hypothetical protein